MYMTFASGSVADQISKKPGVIMASGRETILLSEGEHNPFQSGKVFEIEESSGQLASRGSILYANVPVDSNARKLLFHQLLKEKAHIGAGANHSVNYRFGYDPDDEHAILFIQFEGSAQPFLDSPDYAVFQERLNEAIEHRGAGPIIKHYVVNESDNL